MIKVGIIGAETLNGGELLRLLIYHPETDLVSLYSPLLSGRSVSSVHHGFIGERIVNFSDKLELEKLNILFICGTDACLKEIFQNRDKYLDLKIIDITSNNDNAFEGFITSIGLSEINMKPLFRGEKDAYIPSPELIGPLIALYPLAQYMLLNSPISITISVPRVIIKEGVISSTNSCFLNKAISLWQPSFDSSVTISIEENTHENRVITSHLIIDCPLSLEEIERIYDGIYDDHNFTFVTHSPVSVKEVEGNQKCIISLNKPSSATLEITILTDARMRGGAGDAVHVMNLMQGLHEKTGLQLKSSAFEAPSHSQSLSWFA